MMYKNLYLWGFMGVGKTTAGRIVAAKTGLDFVDLDEKIEESTGLSIPQIFVKLGEQEFRRIEKDMLKKVAGNTNQVVSLGGGVVEDPENRRIIKSSGKIICLTASVSAIIKRTANSNRPLLNVKDHAAKIKQLLDKRKPFYEEADFFVNTDDKTPEEVANQIIKFYGYTS